ncbi:hypothetical protein DID77_00785 [Candidatus Marinamargulisbacteria bacterium SCGC AG-439-L15]|nr:hypothetical protein DID77_00785 [Candidatus Marinamargulisbacteria bacterium SCGC AG-439-L15]
MKISCHNTSQESPTLPTQERSPRHTLTREEGYARLRELEPGNRLYDEIQRALIFNTGIVELSSGEKLYTRSEGERLLGGCWETVAYDSSEQLLSVTENAAYKTAIEAKYGTFLTISPEKCITDLATVSDLLALAYASTKGFKSNQPVMAMLADYQSFVKANVLTVNDFFTTSLQALKAHAKAHTYAEQDKFKLSVIFMGKCKDAAEKMCTVSQELAIQSSKLKEQAKAALLMASDDETITIQQKQEIEKVIAQVETKEKELSVTAHELSASVEDARSKERSFTRRADQADQKAFIMGILSGISSGLGKTTGGTAPDFTSVAEKEYANAAAHRKAAEKTADQANKLRREEIKALADLAKTVQELKGLNVQDNSLAAGIKSLEIAIRTLGKIKTTFENATLFWSGVARQCQVLLDDRDLALFIEVDEKEAVKEAIKESAIDWMVIGKISLNAKQGILSVNEKIDRVMTNLPGLSEAKQIHRMLSHDVLAAIEDDRSNLESSSK